MHDRPHLPMSPAEAASLRASSPVDEALLQRIRAALVGKDAPDDTDPTRAATAGAKAGGSAAAKAAQEPPEEAARAATDEDAEVAQAPAEDVLAPE